MDKKLSFHKPVFEEAAKLAEIYALRDNKTCDSTVLDTYIWKDLYNTEIYLEDEAAIILMKDNNGYLLQCHIARKKNCRNTSAC